MEIFISGEKDIFDLLVQVLIIIIPVVISWFIRTYVNNSASEKKISALVRLSNAAIDYVENLDKRGDLELPPEAKRGLAKLNMAADWLESELGRNGIRITTEDAKKWISSEYQRRLGQVRPESDLAEQARIAVDLIQGALQGSFAELVIQTERMEHFSNLAADWIVAQLSSQRSAIISREEALSWVHAELLGRLKSEKLVPGDELADLAQRALSFIAGLKSSGKLAGSPAVERDIAIAWMLTEAAKLGLPATPEEIAQASILAFKEGKS